MRHVGHRPKMAAVGRKAGKMREMAGMVRLCVIAVLTLAVSNAMAGDRIRVAAQRTGTLAWELDILKAHGLDRQAGIDIETTELASTEAGKVALESGSVDLMLSDWLWVTRERALGDDVVFYPYSSALGAVMVPANSPIGGIADLKGKKFAVAGAPLGARSQDPGRRCLWRAAALAAKSPARRNRRHADVLEFLCRARSGGHA